MRVTATAYSETGSTKPVNQDGYFMKSGHFGEKLVCLAVICDGMGGCEAGEKASNMVIVAIDNWFTSQLQEMILNNSVEMELDESINKFLTEMNDDLISYGLQHQIQLGTTCSILLIIGKKVFVYHVGDSRIYHQVKGEVQLLTDDQTVAAKKVRDGEMTLEEAKKSRERSILLQCVGVRNSVKPSKKIGKVNENDSFLLCSDGFYHALTPNEVKTLLMQSNIEAINDHLQQLVQQLRLRGEIDDATALVLKLTRY